MKKAMIIVLLLVPVVLNAQFGYKYKTSYFNNEFINTHTIPDSTRKIKYNDYTKHREFFHVFPVIGGLIIPDKLEVYDFGAFGGYGYFIQNRWLISVDATFIYYYYHVRPSPEYKDYQNFEIGIKTRYFFLKAAPRLYFYASSRFWLSFLRYYPREGLVYYDDVPNSGWHTQISKVFSPGLGLSVPLGRRIAFNIGMTWNFELFGKAGKKPLNLLNPGFVLDVYIFKKK